MAAQFYKINYKSDFVLTINSDAGWAVPFCIKFWTGMPSHGYFAGFDGENYVNCRVGETPTQLLVMFDDHHMPIGPLCMQIAYHTTIEEFPDRKFDEVTNPTNVTVDIDGTEYQVMLDFTGETAPEIEFNLPAYANEAQRIANENQRIANEAQRIASEEQRIANEEQRISNEEQRISAESIRIANEESRISEFAQLKHDAEIATADANAAATLANEKAALAAEKAALSQAAAELANAKATLAQQKADYAQTQGDYAKAQGDYAKDQGNIAEADHERAESDHTRAENDHTAVEVYVDSLGAFDISAYHATGGVLAKYVDLSAALNGGNNIPEAIRKGGMSVKFVQSSDNKYVQYFLTKNEWSVSEADWQKSNLEEELTELAGEVSDIVGKTELNITAASVFPLEMAVGKTYVIINTGTNNAPILSTRSTATGSNLETIATTILPGDSVEFTPSQACHYLRVGAGNATTLLIFLKSGLQNEVYNLKNNFPLLSKLQIGSSKGVENNALYDLLGIPFNINAYINQNGVQINTTSWRATDYIPVVEGDIVNYRTYAQGNASAVIALYDKDKNFVASGSVLPTESGIVESELTIPANVCYFRSCVINNPTYIDYETCYCTINSTMSLKERLNKLANRSIDNLFENYLNTTKVKANQISEEYYNENTDAELVDSGLINQYYSQSGTSIVVRNMSELGSLFAINVVEGRKYYLKLMQEVTPLVYKSYFIFAIDDTTAAIPDTDIAQYVKSVDTQNYIWEITIPQGCTKVITAGYKNTFGSFWIKEPAQESLEWLLVNEDNLSEELKNKINSSEQEEIVALQTQMSKVDNTLHLFDSIKKPITFNGKTLVAFGDSITYGVSSPNLQPAGNNKYISLFCNYVGCTLNNQAVSGSCITNGVNQYTSIHDKVLAFSGSADIIWVAGGINDWQTQAPIGTYNDTGNTTLYGALKEICSFLKTNYPNAVVIFVTPIPTTSTTTFGTQHPDNLNLYRKAIQEIAAVNGFNVINGADLGLPDEMTYYGNAMFDDSDRVHPTIAGHALYARSLTGKLL